MKCFRITAWPLLVGCLLASSGALAKPPAQALRIAQTRAELARVAAAVSASRRLSMPEAQYVRTEITATRSVLSASEQAAAQQELMAAESRLVYAQQLLGALEIFLAQHGVPESAYAP
jgi:hypothetical protein